MKDRHIPEELIADEILPRLPVKSLLRFRYVCKAWHSTISNRDFIKLHRHHSQSKFHVVHFSYDIQEDTCSINIERLTEGGNLQHSYILPRLKVPDIINSSRDLVVLSHKDGYLLSNPAMHESLYLPHPPSRFESLYPVVGFGFVSSLEKYKVVSITSNIGTQVTCEVFTVGMDNSWRIGKTPPSAIYPHGHTPYVNGNLHMLTWWNDKGENSKILVFNLEKEKWAVMTLPKHPRIPECSIYREHTELRDIQGLLCFTCCFENKSVDIWVLRD